jgi:hypothetical protein
VDLAAMLAVSVGVLAVKLIRMLRQRSRAEGDRADSMDLMGILASRLSYTLTGHSHDNLCQSFWKLGNRYRSLRKTRRFMDGY